MEDDLTLQLPSGPRLQTSWVAMAASSALDEEIRLVRQYLCHISRRRNPVSSTLLGLPAELLSLIMNELRVVGTGGMYDSFATPQRNLQSCALVCSALLPYARAGILLDLRLYDPNAFLKTVRAFRDIFPELRTSPRVIRLTDVRDEGGYWKLRRGPDIPQWDELRPSIIDMLQGLTSVKQLHVRSTKYRADQPTLLLSASGQLTVPTLSRISHLTFLEGNFDSTHTLLSVILQFPSLATLELLYCTIAEENESAHLDHSHTRLALHRLQIIKPRSFGKETSSANDACMSMLCEHILPDSLLELECDLPRTAKSSMTLRNVIERVGRSLQNVHVHMHISRDKPVDQVLAYYPDVIAALSSYAPNTRSMTQTLSWTSQKPPPVDCIVRILVEQTRLANVDAMTMLLTDLRQGYFYFTCADIARIARATRARVRIACAQSIEPLELFPDELWQQRYRGRSESSLRCSGERNFVVEREVYEFEGEGEGCVRVCLETDYMSGLHMSNFHALEFVRSDTCTMPIPHPRRTILQSGSGEFTVGNIELLMQTISGMQ